LLLFGVGVYVGDGVGVGSISKPFSAKTFTFPIIPECRLHLYVYIPALRNLNSYV